MERRADRFASRFASPAGTSCTWPSVIMTTPARRWRGTSDIARVECVEQPRPVVAGAGLRLSCPDHTHVEITFLGEPILSAASAASVAARRSPMRWLGEFVDDDDRDIALRRALLLDQRRIDQGGEQDREGDRAPRHPARAAQ